MLLLVPVLWGSFAPVNKNCFKDASTDSLFITNMYSHFVSSIVFLICNKFNITKFNYNCGLELGGYMFAGQITQMIGLSSISASLNALLVQSNCVIICIVNIKKEGVRHVFPALLSVCGACFLFTGNVHDINMFGALVTIGSSLFYALHTVRLQAYLDIPILVQVASQMYIVTFLDAIIVIASLLTHIQWNVDIISNTFCIFWNGLFVHCVTLFAMSAAQEKIPSNIAGIVYATEPAFAILISHFLFSQQIILQEIIGMILFFSAIVFTVEINH